MVNLLDSQFLVWISKNKATFMLVVLLSGNVYQYIDAKSAQSACEVKMKEMGEKLEALNEKSIEYERKRSEEMQLILTGLTKIENNVPNIGGSQIRGRH